MFLSDNLMLQNRDKEKDFKHLSQAHFLFLGRCSMKAWLESASSRADTVAWKEHCICLDLKKKTSAISNSQKEPDIKKSNRTMAISPFEPDLRMLRCIALQVLS